MQRKLMERTVSVCFGMSSYLCYPGNFFQAVLGLISAFQQLTIPWLRPPVVDRRHLVEFTYMINVYQQIFGVGRFGYGMALLWLSIAIIIALTLWSFDPTLLGLF
jgi:ABC-type sugar transport system permease subunit